MYCAAGKIAYFQFLQYSRLLKRSNVSRRTRSSLWLSWQVVLMRCSFSLVDAAKVILSMSKNFGSRLGMELLHFCARLLHYAYKAVHLVFYFGPCAGVEPAPCTIHGRRCLFFVSGFLLPQSTFDLFGGLIVSGFAAHLRQCGK